MAKGKRGMHIKGVSEHEGKKGRKRGMHIKGVSEHEGKKGRKRERKGGKKRHKK